MKPLCFLLVVVTLANCQTFPSILNENGTLETVTAQLNFRFSDEINGPYSPLMRVFNDIIVLYGPESGLASIMKRNSTGGYNFLTSFPVGRLDRILGQPDTNGEWFSSLYYSFGNSMMNLTLARLASNGTIVDIQHPTFDNQTNFEYGSFHSDGSFIGVSRWKSSGPSKPAALYRYQLVKQIWTLTDSYIFEEKLSTYTVNNPDPITFRPVYQFIGNYFVARDSTHINIYELSSNATSSWIWPLKYSIPYNKGFMIDSLAYNEDDAVLFGNLGSQELILMTRSANGTWNQMTADLNFANIGYRVLSVNKDTFLASVPTGLENIPSGNKIVIVQRRQDTWATVGSISESVSQPYLALAIGINDEHVLMDGKDSVQTIPRCFVDPIEFECPSTLDICDFNSSTILDTRDFCTSNQPSECSSIVTTNVTNVSQSNGVFTVTFDMQRFGAVPKTATVQVQCGGSQPSDPNNNPPNVNSNEPNAMSQPSSAPKNSNNITSGGGVIASQQLVVGLLACLLSCF